MRTALGHLDRTVFERYLDVVNRALFDVRGSLPYNAMLRGLQAELGSRPFVVIVRGHAMDETPLGCRLDRLSYAWNPSVPATPRTVWLVRRDHMHDVLDEPWRFLADIGRIEFPPFSLVGSDRLLPGGPAVPVISVHRPIQRQQPRGP
jgi:hypothetical protein